MGRRPILPFGRWAPLVLGLLALGLLVWGGISGSTEMVVAGAIGAAGLLVAFPLAEFLLRGQPPDDDA